MVERTVKGRLEPGEDRHPGQRQGASQGCAGLRWVEGTRGFRGILTACHGWAGSRGNSWSRASRRFERSRCAQSPPRRHPQGNAGSYRSQSRKGGWVPAPTVTPAADRSPVLWMLKDSKPPLPWVPHLALPLANSVTLAKLCSLSVKCGGRLHVAHQLVGIS